MASNTSYSRNYIATTYADLGTIPIKAGNVISLVDSDVIYYDVPASLAQVQGTAVRKKSSGIIFVEDELPDNGEPEVIYVIEEERTEGTSDKPLYRGYIWNTDSLEWLEIFNNEDDMWVKTTIAGASDRIYFTGSATMVADTESLIKTPNVYLTKSGSTYSLNVNISGNATTATSAVSATSATSANVAYMDYDPNDSSYASKAINSYIHSVSQSGKQLTFIKGDGTVATTVTTVDTTYGVFNSTTDGLVPKTSQTASSDSTGLVLSGSGWLQASTLSVAQATSATSATKDGSNQTITDTYVKSITLSDNVLTISKGNSATSTITLPEYSYEEYAGDSAGLVPGADDPSDPSDTKYLSESGNWISITSYDVFEPGSDGLVPGPESSPSNYLLSANGDWVAPQISSANSDSKLYLLGATAQSASPSVPYTNSSVYIENDTLYQGENAVATISGTEALTNKTYEGYTLGNACTKTSSTSVSDSSADSGKLPTVGAVNTFVLNQLSQTASVLSSMIANEYAMQTYNVGDYCINENALYKCTTAVTSAEEFDPSKWTETTVMAEISNS